MCHPAWGRARIAAQRLADFARLRRVRDRIDREYARPLDVPALARGAGMSTGHLCRQFRLAYGASPYAYLMRRRVERAQALLCRGDLHVPGVRRAVGCSSPTAFSAHFAARTGMSPGAYRPHAAPRPPSPERYAPEPARTP
ncbi:helix-turn-helix transcriptional regulator [Streptomyces sp. NPDC052687]|uniref:helix-turn-helix transcriptional regulator n=1 Tax=Streptomyces sp. NPDC052687 TaxID=3154759 RepID=UPI00343884BB